MSPPRAGSSAKLRQDGFCVHGGNDETRLLRACASWPDGGGFPERAGPCPAADLQLQPESLLLLPLLLLPAQLLAAAGAEVSGTCRSAIHEAAGLHGVPGL